MASDSAPDETAAAAAAAAEIAPDAVDRSTTTTIATSTPGSTMIGTTSNITGLAATATVMTEDEDSHKKRIEELYKHRDRVLNIFHKLHQTLDTADKNTDSVHRSTTKPTAALDSMMISLSKIIDKIAAATNKEELKEKFEEIQKKLDFMLNKSLELQKGLDLMKRKLKDREQQGKVARLTSENDGPVTLARKEEETIREGNGIDSETMEEGQVTHSSTKEDKDADALHSEEEGDDDDFEMVQKEEILGVN
jgi:hypothetical protein